MIPRCQRPMLARLHLLATYLRTGNRFTAAGLAAELEVQRKTVVRDIAFLRDRLGWNFTWNPATKTYRLIKAPAPML